MINICKRCNKPATSLRRLYYCKNCYVTLMSKGELKRKYPVNVDITNLQKEFITGCLLGDGYLSKLSKSKNPSFGIDRQLKDLKYLKWQYDFIKNLCSCPIHISDRLNKTTGRVRHHCSLWTRSLPSLLELRHKWYPNGIKIIPPDLKLSKLIMQIWYCDDGSLETHISTKNRPNSHRIKFATHGFAEQEIKFLIKLLEDRYQQSFSIAKDRDRFTIRAGVNTTKVLLADLKENFPPGIERKMPL